MEAQRHWKRFREGSHGSMKRKPGDRPCSTTRGGKLCTAQFANRLQFFQPSVCSSSRFFHCQFLRLPQTRVLCMEL